MLSQPLAPVHLTHHFPTSPKRQGDGLTATNTNTLSIVYRCICSGPTHLLKAWLANWSLKHWKPLIVQFFHLKLVDLRKDQYFSSSIVNVIHIPKDPPWHVETCVVQCIPHLEVAETPWKHWVFIMFGGSSNYWTIRFSMLGKSISQNFLATKYVWRKLQG